MLQIQSLGLDTFVVQSIDKPVFEKLGQHAAKLDIRPWHSRLLDDIPAIFTRADWYCVIIVVS